MVVCGLGVLAFNQLGREELPEFVEQGVAVSAVLPGGSPEELDLKAARPLQDEIKDIPGVKEVISEATEGLLSMSVTFDVADAEVEARNATRHTSHRCKEFGGECIFLQTAKPPKPIEKIAQC